MLLYIVHYDNHDHGVVGSGERVTMLMMMATCHVYIRFLFCLDFGRYFFIIIIIIYVEKKHIHKPWQAIYIYLIRFKPASSLLLLCLNTHIWNDSE